MLLNVLTLLVALCVVNVGGLEVQGIVTVNYSNTTIGGMIEIYSGPYFFNTTFEIPETNETLCNANAAYDLPGDFLFAVNTSIGVYSTYLNFTSQQVQFANGALTGLVIPPGSYVWTFPSSTYPTGLLNVTVNSAGAFDFLFTFSSPPPIGREFEEEEKEEQDNNNNNSPVYSEDEEKRGDGTDPAAMLWGNGEFEVIGDLGCFKSAASALSNFVEWVGTLLN